ncbi:MAG TPA: glycosyltransferase family 9 protein [Candidatus Ozemobacteraceae bacterium]|nr:glycosyltransferase family 9 protein [Candidatus Ozemobacteraceae bacterium]
MSGILIIRLKGLGDIVHLIPVLRMLRQQRPDETIGLLCQKPFGQIVPPELKIRIFELPNHAGLTETFRLIRDLRRCRFEKLFDLFANPRTAVISLLSGISERYGFDYRIRRHAYTKTFSPANPNRHLMYLFGEFFAHFGINGELQFPNLVWPEKVKVNARNAISNDFNGQRPLLGINPHTTYMSKAWPEEYWIELIRLWFEKTGQRVLVTWGPGEREAAERIVKEAGSDKAYAHAPVRIDEFAALLADLDLFVTSDTGPMNIAWAVNTPVVALFGPTTREAVMPRGDIHLSLFNAELQCLQCHLEVCSHKTCMWSIKPQMVLDKILARYDLNHTRKPDAKSHIS